MTEAKHGIDDLIEGLTILKKYQEPTYSPTHCEHDVLYVVGTPEEVSPEDAKRLDELGFHYDNGDGDCWASFRFGSA